MRLWIVYKDRTHSQRKRVLSFAGQGRVFGGISDKGGVKSVISGSEELMYISSHRRWTWIKILMARSVSRTISKYISL